ncbi:MAG TPA: condensation domain-containing protein, partial [Candidatus Deferrimicrobium sp.]|nr:condensation domain-containing protein [Candidatus Deferrimicrobium sp.]
LNTEETGLLLTKANEAFGTEINDILLTALGLAVKKTFHLSQVLLAFEGHGREPILDDVNINRTIGWFTSLYPVLLEFPGPDEYDSHIKQTKERLRQIPNKGIGYGILKYLTPAGQKQEMTFKLTPEIGFNYLGQIGSNFENSSFGASFGVTGKEQLPGFGEKREHTLEISGIISGGQLDMTIAYSNKQFKIETIKCLWENYRAELSAIIAFCSSQKEKELTPSDFTYNKLSVNTIDALEAMFN